MTRPIVKIHNTETNEIIEREMTVSEFNDYEATEAAQLAEKNEAEAKVTARAAILDRLGLTADEAALLLS